MKLKLKAGDKVLCIADSGKAFSDGDIVEKGKIYTVTDVDLWGDIKLGEKNANKTRWSYRRFVLATELMRELC